MALGAFLWSSQTLYSLHVLDTLLSSTFPQLSTLHFLTDDDDCRCNDGGEEEKDIVAFLGFERDE